jgi:predicted alpha/beta superfamily hydrolase
MRSVRLFVTLLAVSSLVVAQRQVTMRLTVPSDTGAPPPFFLSAEHNRWAIADSAYRFHLIEGRWTLTFPYTSEYWMQYRISRGRAGAMESTAEGYSRQARLAEIKGDTIIDVVVDGWIDRIARRSTATARVRGLAQPLRLAQLGRTRDAWVYLPASYARSKRRYPVVYLMDGEQMFDRALTDDGEEWRVDESLDSLVAAGGTERIVVAIGTGGLRDREYLPYPVAGGARVAEGATFAADLVRSVMPTINRRFRTRTDAQSTAIGGSSMGALIALYTALHYPERFGAVAAFSPPRWPGLPLDSLHAEVDRLGSRLGARVALYVGEREGQETVATTRTLAEQLSSNQKNTVCLTVRPDGMHMTRFWQRPAAAFFAWLDAPKRCVS